MTKFKYLAVPAVAAAATVGAGQAEAAVLVTQSFTGFTVDGSGASFDVNIGGNATAQYRFNDDGGSSKAYLTQNDGISEVAGFTSVAGIDTGANYTNEIKTGGDGNLDGYYHLKFDLKGATTYGYATLSDDGYTLDSVTYEAPVPEPTTWALMILGFGATGAALRRRRQAPALVNA